MAIPRFVTAKREEIRRLAARHGALNVRLFGSFARGDAREESDVDFLVEASRQTSSWFPAGLILDLEGLLGRKVDVINEASLHPLLRDRVLKEAIPLGRRRRLGVSRNLHISPRRQQNLQGDPPT